MAFTTDYAEAAFRHHNDAEALANDQRFANAGYHFGFAAECAFKLALTRAGVPGMNLAGHDPMWKHFGPTNNHLKRKVTLLAQGGRLAGTLTRLMAFARDPAFMSGWDIAMRYAGDGQVSQQDSNRWSHDATNAVCELV